MKGSFLLIKIAVLFNFFLVFAREEAVLSLYINGEKKEDVIGYIEGERIYLPLEDLMKYLRRVGGGNRLSIEGKEYVDLKSWDEVSFEFNENMLEVRLLVPPKLLPRRILNLSAGKEEAIVPDQNSIFLNYSVDYYSHSNQRGFFLINHEMGLRFENYTFLTRGFFQKDGVYRRLLSSLFVDNREDLTRLILGDFITPSLPTIAGSPMAGISYHRNFNIDPYLIYRPTFNANLYLMFPSEVEVYLDGSLIRKERVSPGELYITDLFYYGGRRDIKILIKDPFGRVQEISYPFYFTDLLLREGFREFNYSLGFLRENPLENKYTYLGFYAFERYGLSNNTTIGGQIFSVPGKKFYNLSGEVRAMANSFGVLSYLISLSRLNSKTGLAALISHTYSQRNFSLRSAWFSATEDFTDSYQHQRTLMRSLFLGGDVFISYLGGFSLGFSYNDYKDRIEKKLTFSYNRGILGRGSIFINITKDLQRGKGLQFFAGLNLYPGGDFLSSAFYQESFGVKQQSLQISKVPPVGEGYGYRIGLQKVGNREFLNPYFQYRLPYGVVEAQGSFGENTDSKRLSYSGSLVYVGGTWGLTRPVRDSFGLIKVGDVEGVAVNLNGGFIGRTNSKGYVFLPEMSSYYHQIITINDKDIPLEYDVIKKEAVVSPWFKGGFCLDFSVERAYRYTGRLVLNYIDENKKVPLEFSQFTLEVKEEDRKDDGRCIRLAPKPPRDNNRIKVETFKEGEFYIEGLRPGFYKGKLFVDGKERDFELLLPEPKDLVHDLGELELIIRKP